MYMCVYVYIYREREICSPSKTYTLSLSLSLYISLSLSLPLKRLGALLRTACVTALPQRLSAIPHIVSATAAYTL